MAYLAGSTRSPVLHSETSGTWGEGAGGCPRSYGTASSPDNHKTQKKLAFSRLGLDLHCKTPYIAQISILRSGEPPLPLPPG
jgi:hypothetical protein